MADKCKVVTIKTASEVPQRPIDGKPTLVYWDIVGIVHPLRMALALADVEWCDVRMVCGHSSDSQSNKKEWFQAKKRLQEDGILDFPNLPFYLDSDVKLVQTDAILRYLAKKYNLVGEVPEYWTDVLLEEVRDMDSEMVRLSYEEGGPAVATWLCSQHLRDKLNVWDDLIRKSGRAFATGAKITVVDLKLYTFLYKFQHAQASLMVSQMSGEPVEEVPGLPFFVPAYLERVKKASPQLEAYLESPDMKIPINNPHARFDNF